MATKVINVVIGGESIKWGIKVVILEAVHMWRRAVQKWPITMTEATSDLRGAHAAKRGDINSSESMIVYSTSFGTINGKQYLKSYSNKKH